MFITAKVVGTKFRPTSAQLRANEITGVEDVTLLPEPANAHDENAVQVITHDDYFIGYVERDIAADISPLLRSGLEPSRARVSRVGRHLELSAEFDA